MMLYDALWCFRRNFTLSWLCEIINLYCKRHEKCTHIVGAKYWFFNITKTFFAKKWVDNSEQGLVISLLNTDWTGESVKGLKDFKRFVSKCTRFSNAAMMVALMMKIHAAKHYNGLSIMNNWGEKTAFQKKHLQSCVNFTQNIWRNKIFFLLLLRNSNTTNIWIIQIR